MQQATEKHLFQQRLQSITRQQQEKQTLVARNASEAEVGIKEPKMFYRFLIYKVATKEARMKEDRQQEDMRLVTQLDQKVSDQQVRQVSDLSQPNCDDFKVTLERAGVPGFYVTNNPTEVQVQMYLLEFIVRIGNKDFI